MRVTVCELPDVREEFAEAWQALVRHVRAYGSQIVLLPELPAFPWFCSLPDVDAALWDEARAAHDELVGRLHELGATLVLGSRPVERDGARLNQSFVWTARAGYWPVHEKRVLPDEPGFYEARWFAPGPPADPVVDIEGRRIGFLICSEAMYPERARDYGRRGAELIAVPRATGRHDRWLVAVRMAAILSGSYVLSSNRSGRHAFDDAQQFGGRGWVIDPEGTVLVETSGQRPFATVVIDPAVVRRARLRYPRYLASL